LGTCCNAYKHLLNFTRPDLQPHVLRIILVGPIYAFSASLCLSMSENACFFVRSVRDIWEAVVIYSFLTLIIEYMGGEHLCLHSISQRDEAVPHLFPCNLCLPPISTGSMIRVPKMGALQFVAVKPVVAVVSIVVYACGQLHNWYYQWTLFVIYNISYSVALYALYLIYWSSHEQEALLSKRPLLKFVSVKMIVFLTFWQALLLPLAPLPGSTSRWEDFILSLEMIVFGVLMNVAFSWTSAGLESRMVRRKDVCLAIALASVGTGAWVRIPAWIPGLNIWPGDPFVKDQALISLEDPLHGYLVVIRKWVFKERPLRQVRLELGCRIRGIRTDCPLPLEFHPQVNGILEAVSFLRDSWKLWLDTSKRKWAGLPFATTHFHYLTYNLRGYFRNIGAYYENA
ncbi:Tmem184b, partial [Symbiodinium sp. KB8]